MHSRGKEVGLSLSCPFAPHFFLTGDDDLLEKRSGQGLCCFLWRLLCMEGGDF